MAIEPYIKEHNIVGLINSAGFGRFEPHEEHSIETITTMTALNLTAPMLLSKLLLRDIKKHQGFIINITSIEATKSAKFSALYSATKSGLRAFGLALFEEVRKSGVQVVTINPDMTDTAFFDELRFKPHHEAALDTQSICKSVEMILDLPKEATITELTIRPQLFKIDKK
jgi:short-subunit dehydrogenase